MNSLLKSEGGKIDHEKRGHIPTQYDICFNFKHMYNLDFLSNIKTLVFSSSFSKLNNNNNIFVFISTWPCCNLKYILTRKVFCIH